MYAICTRFVRRASGTRRNGVLGLSFIIASTINRIYIGSMKCLRRAETAQTYDRPHQ